MKNKRVAEVEDILLVGGFAECTILQQHVRDNFPTKRVIVPFDCGLSVLKGAVIYGFDPSYIAIRIIGHTYGVDVAVRYDDSTHDLEHMFEHNDMMYSKSVFKTIIEQETEVSADTKVTREYRTIREFQERLTIDIYVTRNPNPRYVDEQGCLLLGKLLVDIPNPTREKRIFDVDFIFGNTEMSVAAVDRESGEKFETQFEIFTDV